VLAAAGLALVLGGCGGQGERPAARVVDNQEQPAAPSATLPLRGASQRQGGLSRARSLEGGFSRDGSPGGGFAGAPAVGSFDAPGVPPVAPGFEVGELPEKVTAPGSGSVPVRLEIPAIGVATRLVRLGLDRDGAMEVPGDFASAGWFAGGPVPGQMGPAVIAGHVDSRTGPAVFYRLRALRPGQAILVQRADGVRLRFVVEQARSYPKAGFPTAAVFGPVPSAALRLITCTGAFDRARGSYRDNLVVFARLAPAAG
jgi:sortase (surface protein transpeptidase)